MISIVLYSEYCPLRSVIYVYIDIYIYTFIRQENDRTTKIIDNRKKKRKIIQFQIESSN